MTDLPTREEAARYLKHWEFGPIGEMFRARADGDLMTRAEWEATIDYEAREPAWYTDEGHLVVYAPREGEWFLVSVDAAVKEDT